MNFKTKRLAEDTAIADKQRAITRCACGWYFRGLVRDGKQAFKAHRARCDERAAA